MLAFSACPVEFSEGKPIQQGPHECWISKVWKRSASPASAAIFPRYLKETTTARQNTLIISFKALNFYHALEVAKLSEHC
jgi:hypothetical protein